MSSRAFLCLIYITYDKYKTLLKRYTSIYHIVMMVNQIKTTLKKSLSN